MACQEPRSKKIAGTCCIDHLLHRFCRDFGAHSAGDAYGALRATRSDDYGNLTFQSGQAGVEILGLEGMRQADWVLIDANDVIVHLFRPEVREFYGLERMWAGDGPQEVVTVGS